MIKRNLLALVAVAVLGVSAGGVVASADAQPDAAGPNRPVLTIDPFDRHFHLRVSDSKRMHEAWHAWQRLEEKRYLTIVHRMCFCMPRKGVVTEVIGGGITSVTRTDEPGRIIPRAGWTMDRFFFVLRHASATADSVTVTFGRQGVPRQISIDRDQLMIDEEIYYSVTLHRL